MKNFKPTLFLVTFITAGVCGCDKKPARCPSGSKLSITAEGKNKLESCRDQEDRLQGKQLLFFSDGTLGKDAEYKDGKLHGQLTIWLTSGQMISRSHYMQGKKHGVAENWSKGGKKLSETHYAYNQKTSVETLWFPNGNMASTGEYKDGRPHGKWTLWHEDGSVRSRTRYAHGQAIPETENAVPPEIVKQALALDAQKTNGVGQAIQKRFEASSMKSEIASFEMGSSASGLYAKISFFAKVKPRATLDKQVMALKLAREIALAAPLVTSVDLAEVESRGAEARKSPIWKAAIGYTGLVKLKNLNDATLSANVSLLVSSP